MTDAVEIRPGLMPLADWRAIYRGAPVTLDPIARVDVEAGKAALSAILSRNNLLSPSELSNGSPSLAELVERRGGEPLPHGLLRLFVALKLASLGQGMAGMRWSVIKSIAEFFSHDLLPVVPVEDGSDRNASARLFGALTGTGEVLRGGRVRPAQKALRKAELEPLTLNPRERRALLSGTQLSIATALAGLFEAERVFQSATVAAALSLAARPQEALLNRHVHRLYRQRGQIDVAAAFRALLGDEASDGEPRGAESLAASRHAHRMGACLDMLRQAGATLERAANSVTEDQLVLWQSEEIVDGVEDLSSIAAAADLMALALATLGDVCGARIASAAEAAGTPDADAGEAFRSLGAKAQSFIAENRERAAPSGLDPAGLRRLLPMAGTTALIVAIEFLETARIPAHAATAAPDRLSEVRRLVQEAAPAAGAASATGAAAGSLASVAVLVGSGALASNPGVDLPEVAPRQPERPAASLGARRKRS